MRAIVARERSEQRTARQANPANPPAGQTRFLYGAYALAAAYYVIFVSLWFRVDENIDRIGARWTVPKIEQNISASLRWCRALSGLDAASAPSYYRFAALAARDKLKEDSPEVYLFMVESYDARLYQEDNSRAAMWSTARELDNRLRRTATITRLSSRFSIVS